MTDEPLDTERVWLDGEEWRTDELLIQLAKSQRVVLAPNPPGGVVVCNHRPLGRWGKIWAIWTGAAFGSFLAIEIAGLLTAGSDGTWSEFYRVITGRKEPCRHSRAGMVGTLGLFLWGAVHLVWGVLGWVPPRRKTLR